MFGDRLKTLRKNMNISQRDLAKLIKLSPSTVAMYELDQRSPDKDTLITLANLFNCTIDYLLGRQAMSQIRTPILGTIRAGLPILADENIEGYLDVPDSFHADYILRVKGDSMTGAGILDGDLVICKKTDTAQSGQLVVALQDQETGISDAALKYYYDANGHGAVLRPANPSYSEINMSDGYRIGGVMVGLVREDAPGYQTYKNYIAVPEHDEWTDVIDKAAAAGIRPEHLSSHIDMLIEMGKKR